MSHYLPCDTTDEDEMPDKPLTVAVIDDEKNIRRMLRLILEGEGYDVWEAETVAEATELIESNGADAALLDLKLPDGDGLELLTQLRASLPSLAVVMISGHGSTEHAVQAVRQGAYDFLEKPLDKERVLVTLRNAIEVTGLRRQVSRLAAGGEMIGESPQMEEVRKWIARVAPTDGRVLILGESGTGKELVARALHDGSPRAKKKFVKVNCAAIPRDLVESVLFGHVKGAFTGALRDKSGTFKEADGGTLLLDEIGDLSLEAQAKVLRVLQEGEFEPVGASKSEKVDVRVVAATHRDLQAEVEESNFREDLYYRLAVLVLDLPPLRQREGDVKVLTEHFLEEFHQNGLTKRTLTEDALDVLENHDWPGNIRQLRNVIERIAILAPNPEVEIDDLPAEVRRKSAAGESPVDLGELPEIGTSLADVRAAAEKRYLEAVLAKTDGNVSEAARLVGLERTHLHKKLNALGVKR
jgi:two-component system nitrogen regulation response regulator NtrX